MISRDVTQWLVGQNPDSVSFEVMSQLSFTHDISSPFLNSTFLSPPRLWAQSIFGPGAMSSCLHSISLFLGLGLC
jgi:hypothetical protein